MTDILNKLWLNIDNFNYRRIDLVSNIEKDDIDTLHQTHTKFIMKPTLFFIATMAFSRNRSKLWLKLKEYLYKDRVFPNDIRQEIKIETTSNFINTSSEANSIKFIYVRENPDDKATKSSAFRRLSKRNRKPEEDTIKEIRIEPTFSEEYLGFISNHKKNVHKLSGFKAFMKKIGTKNFVFNKGESFVLNSKLVYLPFVIVVLLSIYELLITYVALYFKYQPLIDEYYIQKYMKI